MTVNSECGRNLSRIYIVFAGCEPLEFKNIFPHWEEQEEITKLQTEAGFQQGEKRKLVTVLDQLSKYGFFFLLKRSGAILL